MTARDLFNIAQRYDKALSAVEEETIRLLIKSLEKSYGRLENILKLDWDKLQSDVPLLSTQRQLLVTEQIGYLLQLVNPDSYHEENFKTLLSYSTEQGFSLGDALLNKVGADVAPFAAIPVEAIAYQSEESYRRLVKHGETFAQNATITISEGLIQGWGVQKIIPALRQQLNITAKRAEDIARTESIKAYSNAAQARYIEAGIDKFIWVAVRQGVCEFCRWRNGKVFKIGTVLLPPHVRCRCTLIPCVGENDKEFWDNYSEQVLDGASGNSGLTHFEKTAGIRQAPKNLW